MDLWYSDYHVDDVRLSINVEREIYSHQTEFQHIAILDSKEFGHILTLDGELISTEKDEFFYSEMMVHVPMAVRPKIKKVLVIGGCDGGILKELCKYPTIEQIDVVELDAQVVQICQQFFPPAGQAFQDERVQLSIQDALKFMRRKEDEYDLIIVDSANPFGVNESLFTREFYGSCYNALKPQGVLISQHANAFYAEDEEAFNHIRKRLTSVFENNYVYMASIPTYAAGYLLFGYSCKSGHPLLDLQKEVWESLVIPTQFYNVALHQGAFALPNYIKELL